MTTYNALMAKLSPRLALAEALFRVAHPLRRHALPMVMCAAIVSIFGLTAVGLVVAGLAVVSVAMAILFYFVSEKLDLKTSGIWLQHFHGTRWTTSCGESVEIVSVSPDGFGAVVRYLDGEETFYPTRILRPVGDATMRSLLPPTASDEVEERIENMMKAPWQTPNGDVAPVRVIEILCLDDKRYTKMILRLPSGEHAAFYETQLRQLHDA